MPLRRHEGKERERAVSENWPLPPLLRGSQQVASRRDTERSGRWGAWEEEKTSQGRMGSGWPNSISEKWSLWRCSSPWAGGKLGLPQTCHGACRASPCVPPLPRAPLGCFLPRKMGRDSKCCNFTSSFCREQVLSNRYEEPEIQFLSLNNFTNKNQRSSGKFT